MITWEEIKTMLRAVRRWWWICLLSIGLSSGTAYYTTEGELRYYVARTSLMVGNAIVMPRPDQYEISIGSSLARFYAEMARRSLILRPVQEQLQLPFGWELISDQMLTTNIIPSANLLEIYVTDSNPQRAAAIANAIGQQLVSYSPTSPDKIAAEQQAVAQQLVDSQKRLDDLKAKIEELTARQKAATSASDLAEINQTMVELSSAIEREQSTYSGLLGFKNSSVVNSLNVFEPAAPPTAPLPSKRNITVGLAGLSGLLLSFLAIFLLEQLDTRWRGPKDTKNRLKLDNLGHMPIGPPLLAISPSFFEERFQAARNVQTNILLAAPASGARTLMLTSPQPSESRAAVSIDLADLFSRAGHKVLIVDAEFTRSFLTHMLTSPAGPYGWNATSGHEHDNFWVYLRPTAIPNVVLLPGRAETNGMPALIPSLRWRELVQRLMGIADVIIFDGPSTLTGPDAALLAPHVEGIVLALDPATDSHADVSESKARLLRHTGSNLLGAVTFTPSRQQLYTRKALKAPDKSGSSFSQAPAPHPKPHKPVINLHIFGHEFRVVWGQTKHKRAADGDGEPNSSRPSTARAAATEAAATPHEPIITPSPDPHVDGLGQWYDVQQAYTMPDAPQQASAWEPSNVAPIPATDEAQSRTANTPDTSTHTPIITPAPAADEMLTEPVQAHKQTSGRRRRKATRSRSSTDPHDEPENI